MASTSALSYQDAQHIFGDIDRQFQLTPDTLIDLAIAFLDEFKVGLENYQQPMAMIPTFVTGVPDGTETGTFLALDLGGTNLRVCEVVLHGDHTFSLRQQKYKVSDALKIGEATALFDYLADSVDTFLTTNTPGDSVSPVQTPTNPLPDVVHLGLTFSFPVEQTALGSGTILTWTKGFAAKNAIGKDVVKLLQDAFDRKHMRVKCVALVNDTVGALLSRAYTAGGCILGCIFGTGTNGAYVEEVASITKLANSATAPRSGQMIVNAEWGAFNNSRSHLPTTPFDSILDRLSINPTFQAFEKFVSGMYLGEITRNILVSLVDAAPKGLVFGGKATPALSTQWGLDTSVMSEIEEAWEGKNIPNEPDRVLSVTLLDEGSMDPETKAKLERVRSVTVRNLGYKDEDVSLRDAAIVKWASSLVARRAALLSGVAIAAVLLQTGRATLPGEGSDTLKKDEKAAEKIRVGVDGSLIEFYPHYERTMRESLRAIVGEEVERRVDIGMAKDGSGVGAALCALQAIKQL